MNSLENERIFTLTSAETGDQFTVTWERNRHSMLGEIYIAPQGPIPCDIALAIGCTIRHAVGKEDEAIVSHAIPSS